MKKLPLTLTLLTCLLFLSPNVVLSEDWKDLVKRDGIYYKKFSDVPFSGKLTGMEQGTYKNGKKEGAWVYYYSNGQVSYKGNYKNGEREGEWDYYENNGQLWSKGNFKNSEREGAWVDYNKDGTIVKKLTGTYNNGKKISD